MDKNEAQGPRTEVVYAESIYCQMKPEAPSSGSHNESHAVAPPPCGGNLACKPGPQSRLQSLIQQTHKHASQRCHSESHARRQAPKLRAGEATLTSRSHLKAVSFPWPRRKIVRVLSLWCVNCISAHFCPKPSRGSGYICRRLKRFVG